MKNGHRSFEGWSLPSLWGDERLLTDKRRGLAVMDLGWALTNCHSVCVEDRHLAGGLLVLRGHFVETVGRPRWHVIHEK